MKNKRLKDHKKNLINTLFNDLTAKVNPLPTLMPWKVMPTGDIRGPKLEHVASQLFPVDAAFIVRAVNAHEELVADLTLLIKKYESIVGLQATTARMKETLAKAEGK